ncbi:BatD family protein [Shewanella sp. 6_MG-2023]|uniref:BatD family protein n=1 Tax=Shewanella sp. 6_MG-2023 TaxID=3062660 RepID=UPI0026E3F847|nr:BatD family protein [Shewanella sp. 6_MG-2023]MDO6617714.1 BatD family protein [Shewanella sp. 6_MG-2023]
MVNRIILALVAILFTGQALAVTNIQATVDRNPVMQGEYFVLNVTADDDVNAGSLDTSILLKDFVVGRTSVGRSTQIVNFNSSKETRWQVLLSAKNSGTVTIPAFTMEGIQSNPIELTVLDAGSQPQQMRNLFVEGEVSTQEAYVGQLITYKVKLFLAAELQRGVISAPEISGAEIKQLGEDQDSVEVVNGRRFRVIERTYAMIADTPGKLAIKGASFSGDILVEAPRRGGMFGFNESRPMQAAAEDTEIIIKPIPDSYQGDWLVSDLLIAKEVWPEDSSEFEVGSPITRTINIIASNADSNSLPDIELAMPSALKSYPEKPVRQTVLRENHVVAQYSLTTAIVPTKAGTFTLPEITIPWWNSQLRQQQFTTISARIVTIAANPEQAPTPITPEVTQPSNNPGFWPWLTLLFAALWLITIALWLNARKQKSLTVTSENVDVQSSSARVSIKDISLACDKNDVSQVITLLQQHFSTLLNKPMNLADISQLSTALAQATHQLQQAKYSQSSTFVDKAALLKAIESYSHNSAVNSPSALSSLNP